MKLDPYFYTGTVLHGGGQNETIDESRTGVFALCFKLVDKKKINTYLLPDVAKDLSPEIRFYRLFKRRLCFRLIQIQ